MEENGSFTHAGDRGDAVVWAAFVGQFTINLVREDHEIVLHANSGDLFEFLGIHGCAGWVGREIQHQDAGTGSDGFFQIRRMEYESFIRSCCDRARDAASHDNAGGIGNIARLVIYDLVASVQKRPQCQVNRFRNTHGYENLRKGFVADSKVFLDIVRDAAAEARESEIRRVAGASALKGVDGGLADMPWRCEIRLSDAE